MLFGVAIGGFLGAISRYSLGKALLKFTSKSRLPLSILLINLMGSFFLGVLLSVDDIQGEQFLALAAVGFLGSFTTFSTFSMETLGLIKQGTIGFAVIYLFLTIVGSLLFFHLGAVAF
ncbi:fluoride efflux transporter CrcB [Bacillus timonensis]|nr:fluoride efflux transporter CrcB [Bacillus timonensis]